MEAGHFTAGNRSGARAPLLMTKLRPPARKSDILSRPRLLAKLNGGDGCRLTLLSAPAGYGKTTLLCEWLAQRRDEAVAFVSLDEGDNTPGRFWAYVAAALLRAGLDLDTQMPVAVLEAGPDEIEPLVDSLLAAIINQSACADHALIVALDDYHWISEPAIHQALGLLIERLPPQMRFAIAGRTDPPVALSRLRARGDLLEIRAPDLRFTTGETNGFLNGLMGLGLSASEVQALDAQTEGWIAGLKLAAVALREAGLTVESRRGRAVADVWANSRVDDYLFEEVFQHQSETVQAFLLQTCGLERLSGDACNAATGQSDGMTVLRWLERADLFLSPLAEDRQSYRYHPLFARMLRERAPGRVDAHVPLGEPAQVVLKPPALQEPLSEREVDVLRLIIGGLSNDQIARELVISLATVKWHARNVYDKLSVSNRTQAAIKAREMGLV